jgi:NTP pyrophosphatase (non-canonical NTP hydrolase)
MRSETAHAIAESIDRARQKHSHPSMLALMEEVGELARAVVEGEPYESYRREALDVATVALRIYEDGLYLEGPHK